MEFDLDLVLGFAGVEEREDSVLDLFLETAFGEVLAIYDPWCLGEVPGVLDVLAGEVDVLGVEDHFAGDLVELSKDAFLPTDKHPEVRDILDIHKDIFKLLLFDVDNFIQIIGIASVILLLFLLLLKPNLDDLLPPLHLLLLLLQPQKTTKLIDNDTFRSLISYLLFKRYH